MSSDERERACAAATVPPMMTGEVADYVWTRDTVGESGGAVCRLRGKHDAPDLFLKHGSGSIADDVTDEMARMRWLAAYLPVPVMTQFVRTSDEAWLLMTALEGQTAYEVLERYPDARDIVVDALADFLRRLHDIPIDECPFNSDHRFRLLRARARIDAGLVDVDDFDEDRQGWSAEQVWTALQRHLPLSPDPVVTHGDFSLDNLMMRDGAIVGCLDLGRVGVADRYQDLAIAWQCLGEFDPTLQDRLFARYGINEPNAEKLEFHLMLDEMF